jgi:hypothetical protein
MKRTTTNNVIWTAAILTLAGIGGCALDKSEPKDFIAPADGHRKVNQFADAQAANGAKDDATLQPHHFTGAKLNSLGQDKLAMMVPDDADDDVDVYLNLPASAVTTNARRDAVAAYLKGVGVADDHIKIHDGPNTGSGHAAAEGLSHMNKTETGLVGGGEPVDLTSAKMSLPK